MNKTENYINSKTGHHLWLVPSVPNWGRDYCRGRTFVLWAKLPCAIAECLQHKSNKSITNKSQVLCHFICTYFSNYLQKSSFFFFFKEDNHIIITSKIKEGMTVYHQLSHVLYFLLHQKYSLYTWFKGGLKVHTYLLSHFIHFFLLPSLQWVLKELAYLAHILDFADGTWWDH